MNASTNSQMLRQLRAAQVRNRRIRERRAARSKRSAHYAELLRGLTDDELDQHLEEVRAYFERCPGGVDAVVADATLVNERVRRDIEDSLEMLQRESEGD